MPEGAARFIAALAGAVMAIIGVGGVPLAVLGGSWGRLVLFTVLLFAGIGILGWAYKE